MPSLGFWNEQTLLHNPFSLYDFNATKQTQVSSSDVITTHYYFDLHLQNNNKIKTNKNK